MDAFRYGFDRRSAKSSHDQLKANMLRQIKPRNARAARALKEREPKAIEEPKAVIFLKYTSCSQVLHLALSDLANLKRPLAIKFNKKNAIHPFEDPSSLEFFSDKNDASLLVFGSHSKKRPHALTFIRCFDHKVLDMLELHVDPDSLRTLSQFKTKKPVAGAKPLLSFSGTLFESPTPNAYTLARSLFLDFFSGEDTQDIDVEGLQHMIHISVGEEEPGQPAPRIHLRMYTINTRRSGSKLPRVYLDECGPRLDFRVGRCKEADPAMMKESLRRPKMLEPKTKKNIERDLIGDTVGRIHVGRQELSDLQTRKMKGLKRARDEVVMEDAVNGDGVATTDDEGETTKKTRR